MRCALTLLSLQAMTAGQWIGHVDWNRLIVRSLEHVDHLRLLYPGFLENTAGAASSDLHSANKDCSYYPPVFWGSESCSQSCIKNFNGS